MRLDKFLKVSRLIKRRTVANEACSAGRVLVNGKAAKSWNECETRRQNRYPVWKQRDSSRSSFYSRDSERKMRQQICTKFFIGMFYKLCS